ncbi:MAG: crossover junction endodeoxyribonuclease RuvC [Pseudomonadota bacterium]|nr:crossover junction endodeoxyribonuclease RuvC [Pseudomonadota bacterium]
MPSTIIGIDPGTLNTGYAVIVAKQRGWGVQDLGVIRLRASLAYEQRIVLLHDKIAEILAANRPQRAVLEKVFHGLNAASAIKLGELRGAVLVALHRANVEMGNITNITPAQAKQYITGNGRASKLQVSQAVSSLFNLRLTDAPADATDALALAATAVNSWFG